MVFVEHYPVCIEFSMQKFLQKVSVCLEENTGFAGLATVLPKLVTDSFSARFVVQLCRILGEGEGCNSARLQYDDAPAKVPAQEPWNVQRLATSGGASISKFRDFSIAASSFCSSSARARSLYVRIGLSLVRVRPSMVLPM